MCHTSLAHSYFVEGTMDGTHVQAGYYGHWLVVLNDGTVQVEGKAHGFGLGSESEFRHYLEKFLRDTSPTPVLLQ